MPSYCSVFCVVVVALYAHTGIFSAADPVNCIAHKFDEMTCRWDRNQDKNYSLYWRKRGWPSGPNFNRCRYQAKSNSCTFYRNDTSHSLKMAYVYEFCLSDVSVESTCPSDVTVVNPYLFVKLDPVLVSKVTINSTKTSLEVSWSYDFKDENIPYKPSAQFSLTLESASSEYLKEIDVPVSFRMLRTSQRRLEPKLTERFTDLSIAHNYTISIRVKFIPNGFSSSDVRIWSDPTTLTARTLEDVPFCPPHLLSWNYQREKNSSHVAVVIYWQAPLDNCSNGFITESMIKYWPIKESSDWTEMRLEGDATSVRLYIRTNEDYYMTVNSATNVGYNNSLDLIEMKIPRLDFEDNRKANEIVLLSNDSTVFIDWKEPFTKSTSILRIVCCPAGLDNNGVCKVPVKLISWPTNKEASFTSCDHTLGDQAAYAVYSEYTQTDDVIENSGISWSTCVYNLNKDVGEPEGVDYKLIGDDLHRLIWQRPKCHSTNLISSYAIEYWRVNETSKINRTESRQCQDNGRCYHDLTDLIPFSNYTVRIQSVSKYGKSEHVTLHLSTRSLRSLESRLDKGEFETKLAINITVVFVIVGLLVGVLVAVYFRQKVRVVLPTISSGRLFEVMNSSPLGTLKGGVEGSSSGVVDMGTISEETSMNLLDSSSRPSQLDSGDYKPGIRQY